MSVFELEFVFLSKNGFRQLPDGHPSAFQALLNLQNASLHRTQPLERRNPPTYLVDPAKCQLFFTAAVHAGTPTFQPVLLADGGQCVAVPLVQMCVPQHSCTQRVLQAVLPTWFCSRTLHLRGLLVCLQQVPVLLFFFFFSPAKIRELCPLKQNESAKTTQSMSPSVNLSPKVAQERLQSTGITVWAQYPQTSLKGHHAQHDVVDQCQSAPRLPVLLSVDA